MFVSDKLQELSLKSKFTGHLQSALSWDRLKPKVTEKICQKIFDNLQYVMRYYLAVPTSLLMPFSQCVCRPR